MSRLLHSALTSEAKTNVTSSRPITLTGSISFISSRALTPACPNFPGTSVGTKPCFPVNGWEQKQASHCQAFQNLIRAPCSSSPRHRVPVTRGPQRLTAHTGRGPRAPSRCDAVEMCGFAVTKACTTRRVHRPHLLIAFTKMCLTQPVPTVGRPALTAAPHDHLKCATKLRDTTLQTARPELNRSPATKNMKRPRGDG